MATDPSTLFGNLISGLGNNVGQNYLAGQAFSEERQNAEQTRQARAQEIAQRGAEFQQQQDDLARQKGLAARGQQAMDAYRSDPSNPKLLSDAILANPAYVSQIQAAHAVLDKPAQDSKKLVLYNIYSALNSGHPEIAAGAVDNLVTAEKGAGHDTSEAEQLSRLLKDGNKDAIARALAFSKGHLAVLDPGFAKSVGISDEAYTLAPGDTRYDGQNRLVAQGQTKPTYEKVTNADGSESIVQIGSDGAPQAPGGAAPGGSGQPLSVRLNNPGAIKWNDANKWQGQVGNQGGFVQFDTLENGQRAHRILIANQIKKGFDTPLAWAQHYAPAKDGNDPQAYAATVAKGLGIGVNDKLVPAMASRIADLSASVEAGGSPARATVPGGTPTALVGVAGTKPQPGVKVLYTSSASQAPLDASTIDFYGQKVAAGGDLPQLGMGKEAAQLRQAILHRAAEIQQGQGMNGADSNLLHADVKSAGMSLTQLQKTRNSLDPFIRTFDGASAQVRQLAPQAVGGSIPIFNRWIQAGRQGVSGDPALSKFNVAINAVANENAKIMSGASGGAVTSDSARHEAMTLINNAQTLPQLYAALDQMHKDSTLRLQSLNERQNDLRDIISGRKGGGAPAASANQPAPAKAPPPIGAVVKGYRFNGGDPANRASWSMAK